MEVSDEEKRKSLGQANKVLSQTAHCQAKSQSSGKVCGEG